MEYRTIVCPIDGTELTGLAVGQAAYLSKVSGARLILLHVVEKWYRATHLMRDSVEWQALYEDWLEKGKALLREEAAIVEAKGVTNLGTIIREGDAAHEIVAVAVEERADLIVMATNRYTPVGKLFIGSVTDRVTRRAPCPVLWVF
jgi:nucleotide-binding universal stress UspA family protein